MHEGMVAWFRERPYLDVGEPTPVDIGGITGQQFDVSVSAVPPTYPAACDDPCIPLFQLGDESIFFLWEAYINRVVVLEVEGKVIVATIESPSDGFGQFLPAAQEVLNSEEWKE